MTPMKLIIAIFLTLLPLPMMAGVYGDLEFGDNRDTVTRKLQASKFVKQTMNTALIARTGLNGIFQTKAKLAGMTYHLYFGWDDDGGLKEITLRSDTIEKKQYSSTLYKAWQKAAQLFSNIYNTPVQNAEFPDKLDVMNNTMMMSHIWHIDSKQSILMGTGIENEECFLAIRFLNQRIEPVIIPAP